MNQMKDVKDEMSKNVETGKNELKKSANDWYTYIQEHPMQSMLFGTVIYFALKGLVKD